MIFIIINKFTKWGYFIVYIEEILAKDIALSSCLYQLNGTGESYPWARNTCSIVCLFGW